MNPQAVSATARATAIHGYWQHQQNVITEQIANATAASTPAAAMQAPRAAEIGDVGCRPISGCWVARKPLWGLSNNERPVAIAG